MIIAEKNWNSLSNIQFTVDTVVHAEDPVRYPLMELNYTLEVPGMPQYELHLSLGRVVMLLRDPSYPKLCNNSNLGR